MKPEDLEEAIFDLRSKTEEELADSYMEIQKLEEANYLKQLRVMELVKEIEGLEQEKTYATSSNSVGLAVGQQQTSQGTQNRSPQSPEQRRRSIKSPSSLSPVSPPSGRRLSWGPFGEKTKLDKELDIMEYLSITEQGTKLMVEAAQKELACQEEQVEALEMTSEAQENAIYELRDKLIEFRQHNDKERQSGNECGDNVSWRQVQSLSPRQSELTERSRQLEADLWSLKKIKSMAEHECLQEMTRLQTEIEESHLKTESARKEYAANHEVLLQEVIMKQHELDELDIHIVLIERVSMRAIGRLQKKATHTGDPRQLLSVLLRASKALDEELEQRGDDADNTRLVRAANNATQECKIQARATKVLIRISNILRSGDPPSLGVVHDDIEAALKSSSESMASTLDAMTRFEDMLNKAALQYSKDRRLLPNRSASMGPFT